MSNWHLDNDFGGGPLFHLDEGYGAIVGAESELSIEVEYVGNPLIDKKLEAGCDFEISILSTAAIDLLKLMPEKFRKSQILIDFLEEAGIQVGTWFSSTRDIVKLLNARTISDTSYLKYLGALIGVSLPPEDDTSVDEIRKNIINAIDWYKVKGTYKSVGIIGLIHGFTANLYDMYTNDYSNFEMVEWFVGSDNENPPGLDSSYYKSPHFGVEILLNRVYASTGSGINSHLWYAGYLNNLYEKLEETRPVHTVPHYMLLLNPGTDEMGNEITVTGEIKTKVFGDWQPTARYFDGQTSSEIFDFDDGSYFDTSLDGFIKSIVKWNLGTGGQEVSDSGFDVTPALSGAIDPDDITITDEKITFEFSVPKTSVCDNLNELALCIPGGPDLMVVGSSFPSVDKDSRVEIHVVVEVWRKSLI